MGKRVKLSVIYREDIKAVYGSIVESDEIKIEFENTAVFENYDLIIYPCIKDDKREIFVLQVKNISENVVEFVISNNVTDIFFKNHYVEFSLALKHPIQHQHTGFDNRRNTYRPGCISKGQTDPVKAALAG